MVSRYANPEIERIFSDENKLRLWQKTELAVIAAMVKLDLVSNNDYQAIATALTNAPIDVEWWKKRDQEIHHDLNAFLDERLRNIDSRLHQYFHKNITSYDTEEPAFARSLSEATDIVALASSSVQETLLGLAVKYRYTIMNARTHGQEAEMQSFGARCLGWMKDYGVAEEAFLNSLKSLKYSKLSGAIGKYGSLDPEIEKEALNILGFKPYYGSTQIMPRVLYAPIAQSLCNLILVIDKIGLDIRLAARSGRPLMQEPFQKKQKGSSAMPHKKNTIRTEQLEGLSRMAKGYMLMITDNIRTWEERAIEQSSVERVAWPDLLQVATQAIKVLGNVLQGLKVYPDNMLQEIYESRGVYASSEAKEFLKENLAKTGLKHEDAYRIMQLACFNVFEPAAKRLVIREAISDSFETSLELLREIGKSPAEIVSIRDFIPAAQLRVSESLDISESEVEDYNLMLKRLFSDSEKIKRWHELFTPEFLLRNEARLYQEILKI